MIVFAFFHHRVLQTKLNNHFTFVAFVVDIVFVDHYKMSVQDLLDRFNRRRAEIDQQFGALPQPIFFQFSPPKDQSAAPTRDVD